MDIDSGFIRAFYLFDVADTIDLMRLRTVGGQGLSPADIPLRPHSSSAYLQFPVPPLGARLADAEVAGLHGTVRVKLFDYGIISLRLSFPAEGTWDQLVALAERLRKDQSVVRYARETVARIVEELGKALDDPHAPLVEDYLVIDIERFKGTVDAEDLLQGHAAAVAGLLLGERATLARQEIDESMRVRFSYNADDLTIVQWDTAFIYDRRETATRSKTSSSSRTHSCSNCGPTMAARPRTRRDLYTAAWPRGRRCSGAAEADHAANCAFHRRRAGTYRSLEQRAQSGRRRVLRANLSRRRRPFGASRLAAANRQ